MIEGLADAQLVPSVIDLEGDWRLWYSKFVGYREAAEKVLIIRLLLSLVCLPAVLSSLVHTRIPSADACDAFEHFDTYKRPYPVEGRFALFHFYVKKNTGGVGSRFKIQGGLEIGRTVGRFGQACC